MSDTSCHDAAIEIQVRVRDLVVTVAGPTISATRFISEITRAAASLVAPNSPRDTEGSYSVVESVPATLPETRAQILQSFPTCPDHLLQLSRRLGGLTAFAEGRIRRAYLAGLWAKAVLDNRVSTPNRTEPLQLRSRIYVVLRCEGVGTVLFGHFLLEDSWAPGGRRHFVTRLPFGD